MAPPGGESSTQIIASGSIKITPPDWLINVILFLWPFPIQTGAPDWPIPPTEMMSNHGEMSHFSSQSALEHFIVNLISINMHHTKHQTNTTPQKMVPY